MLLKTVVSAGEARHGQSFIAGVTRNYLSQWSSPEYDHVYGV